ncbi:hypothetical protein [uncultured Paraglaciecola sp.]|uniref:hypothetical protein n=1 Tax=uncultured Paraglaciecola sp. TaxID=1765024 RepID=UPI00262E242A|nr:hypothetical protein [uncultured Paraglaciecola sp.]
MKEQFINKRFNAKSVATINEANSIIDEYLGKGFSLTVRQLYYQFVARGMMKNEQRNYKRLVKLMSDARLAGLTDWKALEDRTRNLAGGDCGFENPDEYMRSIGSDYSKEWWTGQKNYVEVWVEKEALAGVISKPCRKWRVNYFSCRGYTSQSEQYKAGRRFYEQLSLGKSCYLLHLGDHDPSGIDMTRDNNDRLDMFSPSAVTVERMALNMDQVREQRPPPNPAKETDSRHGAYLANYGSKSWELDALDPDYISDLITTRIEELVDMDLMNARKREEADERYRITEIGEAISENYEEVQAYLEDQGWL